MSFKKIASRDELWSGEKLGRVVGGVPVLLVNIGGTICAYEDRCAHQRVPLSEGQLEGHVLTCAAHGWVYDARSGEGINPNSARLCPFEVRVEGNDIYVSVAERETPRAKVADPDLVGPVLEAGALANSIVAAIRTVDPEVRVTDRGSYLRVLAKGPCVLSREALLRIHGPVVFPQDVEAIMLSFKGKLSIAENEMVWTFVRSAR